MPVPLDTDRLRTTDARRLAKLLVDFGVSIIEKRMPIRKVLTCFGSPLPIRIGPTEICPYRSTIAS